MAIILHLMKNIHMKNTGEKYTSDSGKRIIIKLVYYVYYYVY